MDTARLLTMTGDWLLGWTLSLPRDLTLLIVAVILAGVLLLLRSLVADCDLLRRLADDRVRLQQRLRDAKVRGEAQAVREVRRVRHLVAMRRLQAEAWPIALGILPALLVFTWGDRRLEWLPLQVNEPFEFCVTGSPAVTGEPVHLVPDETISPEASWIQAFGDVTSAAEPSAAACWRLWVSVPGRRVLQIRSPVGTVSHPVQVGGYRYEPPVLAHAAGLQSSVQLREYRPFGLLPAARWLRMPAWAAGLLLLTVPLWLAGRRALRIP
jgi:hypothetical protein